MQHKFLLVGNREESPSFYSLLNALTALGELEILPESESTKEIAYSTFDLIIIDAAVLDSEMTLISRILAQHPHARVVVLTASPTWRRAREALQAGAMDYLSKTLSEKEYLDKFKHILAINLRPRP
jgi:DNA-binding NarL/FixJ family response regulator